jgi:orotate phosphoribosyltransferase-like protein
MLDQAKVLQAKQLRDDGLTYQAIADTLGVGKTTVAYWISDGVAERAQAYTRQWKLEHRVKCADCEERVERPATRCMTCRIAHDAKVAEEAFLARVDAIAALRAEGLGNAEIAARLNYSKQYVANTISLARGRGIDVPRSPWYKAVA